jgi:Domain of unknown function (DUF4145)
LSEGGQETKRIFCNCCKGETHHLLRARYSRLRKVADGEDVFQVRNSAAYEIFDCGELRSSIWSCAGCDEETFELEHRYIEEAFEGNGSFFPTRSEEGSIQRRRFRSLKPELGLLYGEVVTSFNNNCLLLCAIGLRALIERVCVDKGSTDGNLEHRIDGLIKFLPGMNIIEALHAFRFAGNDAAHRLEARTREDSRMAIEVMEDLLGSLYDLDYKASQIRSASKRVASRSVTPGSVQ